MINYQNVNVGYNKEKVVLKNINLSLGNGELYILCGPSGVGKSTFLDSLVGFVKPYDGNIIVNEKNINQFSKKEIQLFRKKEISYLPQSYSLIDSINVIDNVCLPIILFDKSQSVSEVYEQGMIALKEMEMDRLANKFPYELSGGEKKRVEIVRCLFHKTPIVIMDEPTNNLDDRCVSNLITYLLREKKNRKTMIVSSHDTRLFDITDAKKITIANSLVSVEQ